MLGPDQNGNNQQEVDDVNVNKQTLYTKVTGTLEVKKASAFYGKLFPLYTGFLHIHSFSDWDVISLILICYRLLIKLQKNF